MDISDLLSFLLEDQSCVVPLRLPCFYSYQVVLLKI